MNMETACKKLTQAQNDYAEALREAVLQTDQEITNRKLAEIAGREDAEDAEAISVSWPSVLGLLQAPGNVKHVRPYGTLRGGIGFILVGRSSYRLEPSAVQLPGELLAAVATLRRYGDPDRLRALVAPVDAALTAGARLALPEDVIAQDITACGVAPQIVEYCLAGGIGRAAYAQEAGRLVIGRRHPDYRLVLSDRPWQHIEELEKRLGRDFHPHQVPQARLFGLSKAKEVASANEKKAEELKQLLAGEYSQTLTSLRQLVDEEDRS